MIFLCNQAVTEITDAEMIICDQQRLYTGSIICTDSAKINNINNDHIIGNNNTCAACRLRNTHHFHTECHCFFHYEKQCPLTITKF